ncbi:glutamine amidotransferase [Bifidobacterium sp. LC6]|uniref:Lipid II isoglutaminyl synthase (glutamine-hydrolyzing) subunit GatD n=1 Tax=Bifidobacterium colobi TaxID=2809026 RepID=A0ABS5UVQ7_9BIFI|nr:glutamine amidotransferase [Bifidobacterium colobi]MBT1174833.1 glutamine amidotransferase [Bifidobacterium colobi]
MANTESQNRPIDVLLLYPKELNIYGDYGNTQVIRRRLEWYGYEPNLIIYEGGDLPENIDMVLGGGGQDSGLKAIYPDLKSKEDQFKALAEAEVPMLTISGLYQMFGKSFPLGGETLEGLGLLDVTTKEGAEKFDGNVFAESEQFGTIIGYEIHENLSFVGEGSKPLAEKVTKGTSNNTIDTTEGAINHHVIGTYLYGPLLPKNPAIADFLIKAACVHRYGAFEPAIQPANLPVAKLTEEARKVALTRP